ncbi:zinc finger protein 417-like [Haliotis rubra]|uniref:zinc finger protein 417-like n=1 Tax=Haliotis rubra TaxID=36100 RepID=UPI001EE5E88D|nr:zinc finger protein 417-like [Haliotis rubra]
MGSIEDPHYQQNLSTSLHRLYETKCLCDITLKTADGYELKAHWLILAAHSEYFHSMHMPRNSDGSVDTVELDVDFDVLKNILDYLYSGKVMVNDSNRAQLLDTGKKLKFEYLVEFISNQTSVMTATYMDKSASEATTLSSLDLRGVRYKSSGDQSDQDQSSGDQSDQDQSSGDQKDHDWFGGSPRSDSQKPDLPTDETESVFLPECLPHSDSVEFDISRVKDEVEEEDPLSSNLQVTFNTEASGLASIPSNQVLSNKISKETWTWLMVKPSVLAILCQMFQEGPSLRTSCIHHHQLISKSAGADSMSKRHGIAILSVDSVGCDVTSEVDNVDEVLAVDDDFDKKPNETPLFPPHTDGNDQSNKFLSPSPRKKRKPGKTAVKTLKKGRAGNFLIRWNKNSICSLCGFEGQISDVVTHRKLDHPEEAHVCPLCFNKSVDHRAMIQHLKRQHLWRESGKYSCEKCGRDCHNRVGLLSHDQIVHGVHHREVLVCEAEGCHFYCAAQSPATMGEHRKGHGNTFSYACDQCDKKYKTRKALKNHMYHHINSQRYQCEICGYFTATPSDLKLHTTTNHSDGPLFKCHVCGNNYRSQYSMDDHLWKVHGLKDDKRKCLQCDECDFITLWQGTLTAHKKIHVTEKNFACEICGKIFRTPNNLSSHRNSTHKESDLHCNFCQHTTKTLDHMRKHLMIAHYYKGVKPYSCVYCSYKSMTGGNVRKHSMVQHPAEDVKYVPDRELLAEMKAKWLSLDKSQWTDVLKNK